MHSTYSNKGTVIINHKKTSLLLLLCCCCIVVLSSWRGVGAHYRRGWRPDEVRGECRTGERPDEAI